VLPRSLEGFLDRVLSAFLIAEDQPGNVMQPGIRRSHQDGERFVIPCTRSLDELSLHVATDSARPI